MKLAVQEFEFVIEARDVGGQIGPHHAVTHAPSGHGIGLGEAVEQDGPLLEAGHAHDGEMFVAVVDEAAVDFVRKNQDVAVADGVGNREDVFLGEHAAGRVLRRVQDDQPGAVGDQRGEFFDVEAKIALLAQRNRNRAPADILDHRLVDGEAGIGIDDFVSLIDEGEDGMENDGLSAGNDDHFLARNRDIASAADVVGNGLAQVRQAGGGTVVSPSLVEGVDSGFDDIGRRVEVGLADFQVNDLFALFFKGAGADSELQRRFRCRGGTSGWQGGVRVGLWLAWHREL